MTEIETAPVKALEATYELLDPAKITVRNIRDAKPSQQLIDSISEFGVLQPIGVLRAPGGELILRFGDRRRKACIEAGLPVPAIVVNGTAGTTEAEISRIFEQLDENDNREDLTAGDRAAAVAALFEYGADERTVTRRTGYGKGEIAAARKAAASETARTLASQYPLTLDQAAVIAEFDSTPELATGLAETARDNPAQFTHAAQLARDEREEAAMLAARTAELTEQGFTVGSERQHYENLLSYWADKDGKPLEEESHKDCPGSLVVLQAFGYGDSRRVSESWYCTDPQGNGHKKRSSSGEPQKNPEESAAERRRVIENNKLWRAATTVRQQWLRDVLLARKDLPADAALFTARALAAADHFLLNAFSSMSGGRHSTARELLGGIEKENYSGGIWESPLVTSLTGISEQRAQVIALAIVVGAYEQQTADVDTWRYPSRVPQSQKYLTVLTSWGYTLSPIEQTVVDAGKEAADRG